MQPGKTKIKAGLCVPTVPTNQMWSSNGAGWVGKVLRAKTQNFPCRWENHEWTTTAHARRITSEKFLLPAWAVRNFSPLLSRMKNSIFVSFTAFSQRKLLLSDSSGIESGFSMYPRVTKLMNTTQHCAVFIVRRGLAPFNYLFTSGFSLGFFHEKGGECVAHFHWLAERSVRLRDRTMQR